jgi:hypothetical protein
MEGVFHALAGKALAFRAPWSQEGVGHESVIIVLVI